MQDIDFDEIDRAVNSVTNTTPPTVSTQSTPTGSESIPVPTVSVAPVTSLPVPSPAVRRSSGRFMDVVHPSSDMRPLVPERSSTAVTTAPVRENVEREEIAPRPEPSAAPTSAFHWSESVVETPVEPSIEIIPNEIESPELADDALPLESPFLSDAKVEKRPLGAFSGADSDLPLLEDPIPFSSNNETLSSEPEAVELPHEENDDTPEELHPDLLLLEAHDEQEPLLEATNPPDTVTSEAPTLSSVPTETPEPSGPTSITQQYKEQPSTTEVAGSIFDTEAYHQPLAHAPNKHSGALVIVWIIALILVGGGIGAGVYFVLLPMLG